MGLASPTGDALRPSMVAIFSGQIVIPLVSLQQLIALFWLSPLQSTPIFSHQFFFGKIELSGLPAFANTPLLFGVQIHKIQQSLAITTVLVWKIKLIQSRAFVNSV